MKDWIVSVCEHGKVVAACISDAGDDEKREFALFSASIERRPVVKFDGGCSACQSRYDRNCKAIGINPKSHRLTCPPQVPTRGDKREMRNRVKLLGVVAIMLEMAFALRSSVMGLYVLGAVAGFSLAQILATFGLVESARTPEEVSHE